MSAASLYDAGRLSVRASSYETAVELFTQAIELEPKQARLYDARASAYEKLGELKRAMTDAREVVRLLPESHKGYLRAGRLWRVAGNLDKAKAMLVEGLRWVGAVEIKITEEMKKEIQEVGALIARSVLSPLSSLPLDIFLDIIYLTTLDTTKVWKWTGDTVPLAYPLVPNALISAMGVCRGWNAAINKAPWLFHTLKLDGFLNCDNALEKIAWWRGKALGQADGGGGPEREDVRGVRKLVITAGGGWDIVEMDAIIDSLKERNMIQHLVSCIISTFEQSGGDTIPIPHLLATLEKECSASLQEYVHIASKCAPIDLHYWRNAFPRLRHLNMHGRTLSPIPPELLQGPANDEPLPLISLAISGGPEPDELDSLWPLISLPTIKRLDLTSVNIMWAFPIPPLPEVASRMWESMEELDISGRIGRILFEWAVEASTPLPQLVRLNLDSTEISTSYLALLDSTNAPNLSHLVLSGTHTRVSTRLVLPTMLKVKNLDISGTDWVDDKIVSSLVLKTPIIERLNLRRSDKITGASVMELVRARMPRPPPPPTTILDLLRAPPRSASMAKISVKIESKSTPRSKKAAPVYSELVELELKDCAAVDGDSIQWLRQFVRPSGLSYKFSRARK